MIIINADDWGRSRSETDAALSIYREGRITSASAMVFMKDSDRAAGLAKDEGVDVGLHLNLSQRFTGNVQDRRLREYHDCILRFLTFSKYALLFYNPFLRRHFRYVYQAQVEEFLRLFGKPPSHIDGHRHMHLCSNMLIDGIIEEGEKVRRSFSFQPGEKSLFNRAYRRLVDWRLAGEYRVTDYFFALSQQYRQDRLLRVSHLACEATVELMTHPAVAEEYAFLLSEDYVRRLGSVQMANYALV
jgi:chitin disaccharide deacetylase